MRYDNLTAFDKYLVGTAPGLFSPLFLILGKEIFECREAVRLLLGFLVPSPKDQELALSIFDAPQMDENHLWASLNSRSFFVESQVIWIQQADKLKKTIQEKLEVFFPRRIPSLYLILSASGWQKNTTFFKAVDKEGIVLEFAELKPWEKEKRLAEWVNKQAAAERKLISYQVCQSLVKQMGSDQSLIEQELKKLICYCGEKKEITGQDVDAICTRQSVDSVWLLGETIFCRDAPAAIRIAIALLEGQALLPLLRQIRAQFQTEYQVCLLLAQGKHAQDIAQEFPYMKGKILERHIWQARQYGLEAFKRGLIALDTAESRVKNSSIDDKVLLELLIMQLIY